MALVASAYTYYRKKEKKYKVSILLLLSGVLSLGYGEDSALRKLCKTDFLTRIVYGLLLSIPFLFFGKWYASIALPIAFSIRAGSFKIGRYDFLYEDFIRYATLGVLVVM